MKIPVTISRKLQAQILWLCRKSSNLEWSGVLYYNITGEFGTREFAVKAEELFLMDIGSSTFTGYSPADPQLISHMMANPHLMQMRLGHIHSHHNMEVFFSDTDEGELMDNAPHHNFYLSLIVNNKNEMDARVAFVASLHTEAKTITSFRGVNGDEKTRESTTFSDSQLIYAYRCEIGLEEEPEENFRSRFQGIQQKLLERKEKGKDTGTNEAELAWAGNSPNGMGVADPKKFSGRRSMELFDDAKQQSGSIPSSKRTYQYLAKLLALDTAYRGTVKEILAKRSDSFFGSRKYRHDFDNYCSNVSKFALKFYKHVFYSDTTYTEFNYTIEECEWILDIYQDEYPEFIKGIIEVLHKQKETIFK